MVYMSGGKMARNQASIVNRNNTCGGVKKTGLRPTIGSYGTNGLNMTRAANTLPLKCVTNTTVQTQKTGYAATHGGNMG